MLHRKREGQAGIAMVLGLCSTVEYLALANGNRVRITLRSLVVALSGGRKQSGSKPDKKERGPAAGPRGIDGRGMQ